ncbi:MAG: DNA-3-methyladenine glycosylase 2 family protein [Hyphomicrobiaceae bacterium]
MARRSRRTPRHVSHIPNTPDAQVDAPTSPPASTVQAPSRRAAAATPPAIESEHHIADGIRFLRRRCALVRTMHDLAGDPPLRRRVAGFEGLARIIVGQQLSVASAAAIWSRVETALPEMSAVALLAADHETLRASGLSRPKIRTLRAASEAIVGGLDLALLETMDDAQIHDALTAIPGIGPWTADIFIMFCLGRPDAFARGDLALQIAAQYALTRDARLSADELEALAERWRPWRGVAARLLWAYYKAVKDARSGIPV